MLSTLLDLLGFAALTAATYLLAGPAGALYVAGVCLLVTSLGVDDDAAAAHVRRLVAPVRQRARAIRQRLRREES